MLALLLLMVTLSGCPSRKEVDAELWLNTGLPPEVCAQHPEILQHFGIYRVLDSGKKELVSYCAVIQGSDGNPAFAIQGYTSVNTKKLKGFLDDLLPAQQVVTP